MSQVAERYASAIFELLSAPHQTAQGQSAKGQQTRALETSLKKMSAFAEAWNDNADWRLAFSSPAATNVVRRAVVAQVADRLQIEGALKNFLLLLSDKGRIPQIAEITAALRDKVSRMRGQVVAVVESAGGLSSMQTDRLSKLLTQTLGSSVVIEHKENPDLIAGFVCRVGDHVFDGSLINRLRSARQELLSH